MDNLYVREELRNIYDYSNNYDPEWRSVGAVGKVENIEKLCSSYPHRSILEIGAGDGAILSRLSDLGFADELFAVEISETAVSIINRRKIRAISECKLFDGYHIPYADNRFDLALLSHVVEHVEYPRKILYEAKRVAKYIFIEVPLEDNIRLAADFTFSKHGHINYYSHKSMRRLVQSTGLRVLRQSVTNPPLIVYKYRFGRSALVRYYVKECLLWILPSIATSVFTYHCSFVCDK